MKKLALFLALTALTACQDMAPSTSPFAPAAPAFDGHTISPAPPPPNDTGAVAHNEESGTGMFSVVYMFNKPETAGFIHFNVAQPNGTTATDGARITYHKGVYGGAGLLSYQAQAGVVTVDLASISQTSSFGSCSQGCFFVAFDRAVLTSADGTSRALTSPVRVTTNRKLDTRDGEEVVLITR